MLPPFPRICDEDTPNTSWVIIIFPSSSVFPEYELEEGVNVKGPVPKIETVPAPEIEPLNVPEPV
jgi:hypothetical protein